MSLISMMRTRKRQIGEGWPPYVVGWRAFDRRDIYIFEWPNSVSILPEDSLEFDRSLTKFWESI